MTPAADCDPLPGVDGFLDLPPRLAMLTQIARVLRVDVWALTDTAQPSTVRVGPGHAHLPAVRDALNRWPIIGVDAEPQPLDHMRARVDMAWRARHAAPDHRTVIGALLPDLIRDAQHATRAHTGRRQMAAQALLADVLGLTQMFLAYQPAADLLWRTVDRAVLAAQESGDPLALCGAVWFAAQAHRDAGDWDTAMAVTLDTLQAVKPGLPDAGPELLAMWGALQVEASHTAARSGEAGGGGGHPGAARGGRRRVPGGLLPAGAPVFPGVTGPPPGDRAGGLTDRTTVPQPVVPGGPPFVPVAKAPSRRRPP